MGSDRYVNFVAILPGGRDPGGGACVVGRGEMTAKGGGNPRVGGPLSSRTRRVRASLAVLVSRRADRVLHRFSARSTAFSRQCGCCDDAPSARTRPADGGGADAGEGAGRYRVPTGADLKSLQSSGLLDEADLEEAVRRALRRMDLDFALRTGPEEVMGRLFPGHGAFDEAAAASIFGTSPEDVYGSVAQEEAKPKPEDKARLKAVGRLALREMQAAKNDDEGLRDVFGKKASVAKARYPKGRRR